MYSLDRIRAVAATLSPYVALPRAQHEPPCSKPKLEHKTQRETQRPFTPSLVLGVTRHCSARGVHTPHCRMGVSEVVSPSARLNAACSLRARAGPLGPTPGPGRPDPSPTHNPCHRPHPTDPRGPLAVAVDPRPQRYEAHWVFFVSSSWEVREQFEN